MRAREVAAAYTTLDIHTIAAVLGENEEAVYSIVKNAGCVKIDSEVSSADLVGRLRKVRTMTAKADQALMRILRTNAWKVSPSVISAATGIPDEWATEALARARRTQRAQWDYRN